MSRRSRAEVERAGIEAIRGWQTDQDMFDEAVAVHLGINRTDARCLDVLDRGGRMTAGQLAAAARLTSGAVTAVLDRLERIGLVRRVDDPSDRRRVLVEVTPELASRSAPLYGPMVEEGVRWIATYTDDQLETIVDFMERTRDVLQRHTTRIAELTAERARRRGRREPAR
jgi:DNA-binding MarR family transcriptional regulator